LSLKRLRCRIPTSTGYYRLSGGVVEDPATGAAAGAFGGYLRELRLVSTPSTITIHQGDDLGRPSVLTVQIPTSGGIGVAGTAVRI
jgi:PhzF family phenazine biosynthesis protein